MAVDVFAVPVFFVVFREALEVVVVVSVLFAFLKQTLDGPERDARVYKRLVRQVWLGIGLGVFVCLCIGGGMIGAFYKVGVDHYSGTEYIWEGSFAIVAAVVISILGAALLRVSKMKEKWAIKLAKALDSRIEQSRGKKGAFKRWVQKYIMFTLPFVTVLREGIEAVVFISGVTFSSPAASVPLPVFVGLIAGSIIGYILYRGGASTKLQYFLIFSTCLLYLVAAGLFSRGVWYLQAQDWNNLIRGDAAESGAGPGSYDISKSVWHVNYGNPGMNGGGGWGIFNAILGWQNSATYGSVISYNLYWMAVIIGFLAMRYNEVTGHWPLMKAKRAHKAPSETDSTDGKVSETVETLTSKELGIRRVDEESSLG